MRNSPSSTPLSSTGVSGPTRRATVKRFLTWGPASRRQSPRDGVKPSGCDAVVSHTGYTIDAADSTTWRFR